MNAPQAGGRGLSDGPEAAAGRIRSSYDEVYSYTMGRGGFILQHVVEAYAAQTASNRTKPIGIVFPGDRGRVTVADVLEVPPGPERDRALDEWCRSVWAAYGATRQTIVNLLHEYRIG